MHGPATSVPPPTPAATYERLSKLDQSFLAFETPTTPMHLALTAILEAAPLANGHGGGAAGRICSHIASRLHLIPRYRQRLAFVPLVNDAIWVDDPDFDIAHHVRHTSLPAPGSDAQLRARCAEILERPLSRSRPLWESWIIEGLARGRLAVLTKVHHCLVDGVGGMELLAVLLGATPSSETPAGPSWRPRPAPRGSDLARDTVLRRSRRLLELGRELRPVLSDPRASTQAIGTGITALWSLLTTGVQRSPAVPFNGAVGPCRRTAWLSMNLDQVKAVGRPLGATVNDVALATVAGGVRRTLARRQQATKGLTLKLAVPVNARAPGISGELGNRVSAMLVPLPVDAPDPVTRLRMVRETTARLKSDGQRDALGLVMQAAEWTSGNALQLAVRLVSSASPYNLIVTNIPGPPNPLFLLAAPMVAAYPHLPLFEGQGLGIAILSYAGALAWGLTADPDLMPDLDAFAADLAVAFEELCGALTAEPLAASDRPRPPAESLARLPWAHHAPALQRPGATVPLSGAITTASPGAP
jgi:WS/DGAT/MGAT family acyltransferase